MSDEYSKEKNRLISAINKILNETDSLWVINVILRFTEGMTKEGGAA